MSQNQFLAFDHQDWIDETNVNVVIQGLMCVAALNNDHEAMTYLVSRFKTIIMVAKDKAAVFF